MRKEHQFLLYLVRQHLTVDTSERLFHLVNQQLDWAEVMREIQKSQIGPLCHRNLSRLGPDGTEKIPTRVREQLDLSYRLSLSRTTASIHDVVNIFKALNERQLKVILMRGLALGRIVYRDIALRPFRDVDLFTTSEDWPDVETVLHELGYRQFLTNSRTGERIDVPRGMKSYWRRFSYEEPPFRPVSIDNSISTCLKNLERGLHDHRSPKSSKAPNQPYRGINVDLHHALVCPTSDYAVQEDEVYNAARNDAMGEDTPIWTLAPEDFITFLFEHHVNDSMCFDLDPSSRVGMPLKNCCDIHDCILRYKDEINWKKFEDQLRRRRMVGPVKSAMHHVGELFDSRFPENLTLEAHGEDTVFLDGFFCRGYNAQRFRWKTSFSEIVFGGNNIREAYEIFKHEKKPSASVDCPKVGSPPTIDGHLSDPLWKQGGVVRISEEKVLTQQPFGTHIRLGDRPASDSELSACGYVCYDDDFLYLGIEVVDDSIVPLRQGLVDLYASQAEKMTFYDHDEVTVIFDVGDLNPRLKKFKLCPAQGTKGGALCLVNGEIDDRVILQGNIEEKRYCLEAAIPFCTLEIRPIPDKSFDFDMIVSNCDEPAEGVRTILTWAGGQEEYDVPYGSLTFKSSIPSNRT